MTKLIAFHGDPAVKEKYLARIRAHKLADEIVKGQYWENGKGCAVGCTIHSGKHADYEPEIGIPEWIAHLEEHLFESMPNEDAKEWPERLLKAIPEGFSDWDNIKHQYLEWLLVDPKDGVIQYAKGFPEVEKAIKDVAALHREPCEDKEKWHAARSAAWSAESAAWHAARSAESAARSAARSAVWSAVEFAWSAESAARSAAWSAVESAAWFSARSAAVKSAAWFSARSAAVKRQADKLIELLSN